MTVMHLRAGGRVLPVEVGRRGKKLSLGFRYFKPLIDEIRCMVGRDAKKEDGVWTTLITDCERNQTQLAILRGEKPACFAPYERAPGPSPRFGRPLRAHQASMVEHGMRAKRVVWAAEQGTGKTLSAIEVIERVGGKWLWVGPAKALEATLLELKKWKYTGSFSRVKHLRDWNGLKTDLTLVSYSLLRPILEIWGDADPPEGVVFDESVNLKTPGAKRTKAAMYLGKHIRQRDGYILEMSGLPAPKDPCDWWAQAEVACPGWLRESNVQHLRRRLAIIEMVELTAEDGTTVREFPKIVGWHQDEVELLGRRLQGLVQVHYAKDCLDLPSFTKEIIQCEPSDDLLRAAKLVVATSINGAQALNKLRQLSDGFQYRKDAATKRAPCPKDDVLRTLLGRSEETGRIVIYAGYKESVDRAVDLCLAEGWPVLRCDGRGWKEWDLVHEKPVARKGNAWLSEMDESTRTTMPRLAYVAHPKAGGIGLNLTAARWDVFFGNDFDFGSRGQAEKRSHRMGQTRGVTVFDIFNLKSDKFVLDNLEAKRSMQSVTLEEIKRALA